MLSPVQHQPVHKNTRRVIYAADLCIATQDASFEKTESTLSDVLDNIGEYYVRNHMRANPEKAQTCIFHIRYREANRKLNISWCGKKTYLGVMLVFLHINLIYSDVFLHINYSTHIAKVKAKTATRNIVLNKLSNLKWGANPATIRTIALAHSYTTLENACPVWKRSAHAHKVDPV